MHLPHVAFAILSVAASVATGALDFVERPANVTIREGSSVYLVCRYGGMEPGSSDARFTWNLGSDYEIYDVVTFEQDPSVSAVKLISDDTRTANTVSCRVNQGDDSIYSMSTLRVLASTSSKPGFPSIYVLSEQTNTLEIGKRNQPIRVSVTGQQPLQFRWFKDNIPLEYYGNFDNYIVHTEGALEMKSVTAEVAGSYELQVSNQIGTVLSSRIIIYARSRQIPLSFIPPMLPGTIEIKKGESRVINCTASGMPVPRIKWYRTVNGVEAIVPPSETFEQPHRTTYYLRKVQVNQTARCRVSNDVTLQPLQHTINIVVLDPPSPPTDIVLRPDITTADISWRKPFDATSSLIYYKTPQESSWRLLTSAGSSLRVTGLAPFTSYQVKLACVNNVGPSANSSERHMKTLEFTAGAPANLRAEHVRAAGTGTELIKLSWEPPPRPNGVITSYTVYHNDYSSRNQMLSYWSKDTVPASQTSFQWRWSEKMIVAKVQAANGYGLGNISHPYVFPTEPGVPGLLTDFRLEVISPRTVNMSWTAVAMLDVADVSAYLVQYNSSLLSSKSAEVNASRVLRSYDGRFYLTVSSLEPDTGYTFRMAAKSNKGRVGVYTSPLNCRTFRAIPSACPGNVKVSPTSTRSVVVDWDYPVAPELTEINRYYILYRETRLSSAPIVPSEDNRAAFLQKSSYNQFADIQGLDEETCYDFYVCASNTIGNGSFSENARFCMMTQEVPAPTISTIDVLNSTSVRLRWSVPPEYHEIPTDLKSGFQISYSYREGPRGTLTTRLHDCLGPELTSCVMSQLQPDTSYAFQLAILLVTNSSPKSNTYNVRTKSPEPSPPENVQISLNDETVSLTWDHTDNPNFPTTEFKISWTTLPSGDVSSITEKGSKRSTELNLAKGAEYVFTLQAKNDNGISLPCEPQTLSIPAEAPSGAPREVSVVAIGPDKLFVSWKPPSAMHQNGEILDFLLKYKIENKNIEKELVVSGEKIIISQLSPQTSYAVRIAARNSAGLGPFSVFSLATTFRIDLEAPQNVRVQSSSQPEDIRILWEPPAEGKPNKFGYTVYYSANPSLSIFKWNSKIVPNDESSGRLQFVEDTILSSLEIDTMYGIRVAARLDEFGENMGPLSTLVLHRVGAALYDDFDIIPMKVDATYMIFTWKKPAGVAVTHYVLSYYNPKDPNADKGLLRMEENATVCLVAGLTPYSQYFFNMTVLHLDEIGSETSSLNLKFSMYTKATLPKKVGAPTLDGVDRRSGQVRIKFPRASPDLAPVDAYQVVVVELTGGKKVADLPSPDRITLQHNQPDMVPLVRREVGSYRAYIAAELSAYQDVFTLGDGSFHRNFHNRPLEQSATYTAFLRVLMFGEEVQFASSPYMDSFSLDSGLASGANQKEDDAIVGLMWIIGVVSSVIILIVVFILGVYLYKRKRTYGGPNAQYPNTKYDMVNGYNECLPLSNGNLTNGGGGGGSITMMKTCYIDDPVEMRRTNFPTAELTFTPPVPTNKLAETIDQLKANNNVRFYQQFKSIEPGQQFFWENSNLEVNKSKNRYANVIAYDHSRVHLKPLEGVPGSDYINANYMDGYRRKNAYISTQGPLPETLGDFWRMVWEQSTYTIVMMTRLEEKSRTKCDQYWPDETEPRRQYGHIQVVLECMDVFATHTIRIFKIKSLVDVMPEREVRQFQFTGWPDHGVPEYPTPVLNFVNKVKHYNPPNVGPIVVHCSAGVGRTGCFIVIDTQLEKVRSEDTVDIYGHVTCLRAQRQYMVQTEDQYIFCYDALLEAVQSGNTEFSVHELANHINELHLSSSYASELGGGGNEFERLSNVKQSPSKFQAANLPENMLKNRLANHLPYESTRVKLNPIRGQTGSDYINASYIDGYFHRQAYIATQAPLESTVYDFWRMLWEQNSSIIVMLTKLKELGREKCAQYWPDPQSRGGLSVRYNFLVVEPSQEYAMTGFVMREFRVTDARDGSNRIVRQFHFDWPEQGVPKVTDHFLDFILSVHKAKATFGVDGPITVHCSSGSARTGVFIALKIVLERMQSEGLVDVFQTVKMLRTQRPAMVQTEDQYQFIYQAALDYFNLYDAHDPYNTSRC